MSELLRKDMGIKAISVLLAIILWFFVLDNDNPVKTKNITIPFKIENESTLQEKGLVIRNKDYQKTLEITIQGRQEVINDVSVNDFKAVLDFSKIKDAGGKQLAIDGPYYIGNDDIKIEGYKSQSVSIELDRIGNNAFPVNVDTKGDPKDSYKIVKMTISPEAITIDGTDTLIKSIDVVKASIDISGLDQNAEFKNISCNVIGKSGKQIDVSKKYNVDIKLEVARELPVIPAVKGKPAKNYIEGVSSVKPEKALISGSHDVLSQLNSLSTDTVDIENASANVDITRSIKLPEGVNLVDTPSTVAVSVPIEQLAKKEYVISKDDINLINTEIDNSLGYEILTQSITISLKGSSSELDKLDKVKLSPKADVSKLGDGTHTVLLKLTLPDNVKLEQDYNVDIKIEKR